jgi:hypothetical protein
MFAEWGFTGGLIFFLPYITTAMLVQSGCFVCTVAHGLNSIGHHSGRRIVSGTRNVSDVAILMDCLPVFVGRQIDRQIDRINTNYAVKH